MTATTSTALEDLFFAFSKKALSHQLEILPKLQDKYFWKLYDIWFAQNWDKDKRYIQERKRQESHSPLLTEAYLISKLPTNEAAGRNAKWAGAGTATAPSVPEPREDCSVECGPPTHRRDFISESMKSQATPLPGERNPEDKISDHDAKVNEEIIV